MLKILTKAFQYFFMIKIWKLQIQVNSTCGQTWLEMKYFEWLFGHSDPSLPFKYWPCQTILQRKGRALLVVWEYAATCMDNPHIAADGFTYEYSTINTWLENKINTSPMTNNQTLDNKFLIPNHALRSAILEWKIKSGFNNADYDTKQYLERHKTSNETTKFQNKRDFPFIVRLAKVNNAYFQ